jgi:hypothetical protein
VESRADLALRGQLIAAASEAVTRELCDRLAKAAAAR